MPMNYPTSEKLANLANDVGGHRTLPRTSFSAYAGSWFFLLFHLHRDDRDLIQTEATTGDSL